jgi:uncharacterized protein (DUF58 family)
MEKKFQLDFEKTISQFEQALKRFQTRKVIYKSVFRGKGLEFDSYRNFEPDEDASMIDWRASLRANKLLAREYIEERDLNIYFILDVSSSMLFGSQKKLKAEYVAELIAAMSHLIVNSGDSAGLIMFNNDLVKLIRATKSKDQFYLITKFLSYPSLYGGNINFKNVFDKILGGLIPPLSIVIIISDFINLNQNFEKQLKILGTKFETMGFMVRDPLDNSLPETNYQIVLQDPSSNRQMLVDTAIAAEEYKMSSLHQKNMVKKLFSESGIDLLELHTDQPFVLPIASFLKTRAGGVKRI